MTRAILDFPDTAATAARSPRLLFHDPVRVLAADALTDVVPCLRAVEAAVAGGAWAVGFVAYEAAPAFDAALATRPHRGPTPLAWFGIFDAPAAAPRPDRADVASHVWQLSTPRLAYDEAVRTIREGIAAGDVYQVNHTLRFHAPFAGSAAALYDALTARRQGLYHAFIEDGAWAVVSASPELFFERDGRDILTRPMKGTLRRGRWLDEDRARVRCLADSPKDRAENLMIVDLLRNDLGRVAEFGSVRVPRLFEIETYPTVHQMTSTITATLRADVSLCDIFAAMFPCGSVTGAPKVTAMRTIARLEEEPRGPYCGAVGVVRPDGSATFNVAIRTLVIDTVRRDAVYGAGGGITWDSSADAEYDEIAAKAALLDGTPDFALLETLRCDDGVIPRLELHLRRLEESALYWGFPERLVECAANALERFRRAHGSGSFRVRLTASRELEIRITHTPLAEAPRSLGDDVAHQTVALCHEPVDERDPLLCHKTTARQLYDARRATAAGVFDVLLHNRRGELTEFSTGNLVIEMDGRLLTPARACGLLAGTFRQQLLEAGAVAEAIIEATALRRATRIWHVNSVRGATPVVLRR
jgi:para-aminobenzoate synthetase / 4-amino-4-deoxychorismate lyase